MGPKLKDQDLRVSKLCAMVTCSRREVRRWRWLRAEIMYMFLSFGTIHRTQRLVETAGSLADSLSVKSRTLTYFKKSLLVVISILGLHQLMPVSNAAQVGTGSQMVNVTIYPQEAINAGAQWKINGSAWLNSNDQYYTNSTGSMTITFKSVTGWVSPADITFTMTVNGSGYFHNNTYTLNTAPVISSFTPSSGVAGNTVTINGTNLANATSVKFSNNVAATIQSNTSTKIVVIVPTGVSTGKLTVVTGSGAVASESNFTVASSTYTLTTAVGQTGWGTVNPSGSNSYASGTSVTVTATANAGYQFTGWTGTVTSSDNPISVTMISNKNLTANFAVQTAGISVTVQKVDGSNYGSGALVKLYNSSYTTPIDSKTTGSNSVASWTGISAGTYNIEVWSPAVAGEYWGGQGNVIVTAGQAVPLTIRRNEPYATAYNAFSESTEVTGGAVALNTALTHKVTVRNGLGFARNVKVLFRADISKAAPYDLPESPSAAQSIPANGTATFSFPHTPTVAGAYSYSFEVLSNTNASDYVKTDSWAWSQSPGITVSNATPAISGITPTSGTVGTSVTITGTNLSNATAVKFNGTTAAIMSNTATQIVTAVPAGATNGPISVTTAGGTATSSGNFAVSAINVPESRFKALDPLNGNQFDSLSPLAKLGTAGVSIAATPLGELGGAMIFASVKLPSVAGETITSANFLETADPRFILVFEGLRNSQVEYEAVNLADLSAITWDNSGRSLTIAVYSGSPLYSRIQAATTTLRAVRIQKKKDRFTSANGTRLAASDHIDASNMVIVVHGWNPSGSENPFSEGKPLRELMELVDARMSANWATFGYNWAEAAATGGKSDFVLDPLAGRDEKIDSAGIRAAENGYLYGLDLADELERRATLGVPTRIHFIAHSAGAWVIYSAVRRLADRFQGSITFQITLLDPFMPKESYSSKGPLGKDLWTIPSIGNRGFC